MDGWCIRCLISCYTKHGARTHGETTCCYIQVYLNPELIWKPAALDSVALPLQEKAKYTLCILLWIRRVYIENTHFVYHMYANFVLAQGVCNLAYPGGYYNECHYVV